MRLDVDVASGKVLEGVIERANDPRRGLLLVADLFYERQKRVFATAGFGQWAPVEESTAVAKGGGRTLVDTGGLLLSLTTSSHRYSRRELTRDGLAVGTRNPVAHLHEGGARGIPVRDPVPPTTAAERESFAESLAVFVVNGPR